jgi:hypothetical protein
MDSPKQVVVLVALSLLFAASTAGIGVAEVTQGSTADETLAENGAITASGSFAVASGVSSAQDEDGKDDEDDENEGDDSEDGEDEEDDSDDSDESDDGDEDDSDDSDGDEGDEEEDGGDGEDEGENSEDDESDDDESDEDDEEDGDGEDDQDDEDEEEDDDDDTEAPPDPETDIVGWEDGYWYNESVEIDQSDGLSEAELEEWTGLAKAHVEYLTEREFTEDVSVSVRTPEEAITEEELAELREVLSNDRYQAWNQQTGEALFLAGENATNDPANLTAADLLGGVSGFYDPAADELVILRNGTESPAIDNVTLHHELVHAVQDQTFDLSDSEYRGEDGDEATAINGLIEGDAVYVTERYVEACNTSGAFECVETPPELYAPPREAYGGVSTTLAAFAVGTQPYTDGLALVTDLHREGGQEAVDEAFENPPSTTEQTIHPERYPDEEAVSIDVSDTAENGWEPITVDEDAPDDLPVSPVLPDEEGATTIGELGLFQMFAAQAFGFGGFGTPIVDLTGFDEPNSGAGDFYNFTTAPTEGWGNDALVPYGNDDEAEGGYVWVTEWDSERDARQFRTDYLELLETQGAERYGERTWIIPEDESGFADAFHVTRDGTRVTIVNAPTVDDLDDVRSGIDIERTNTTLPIEP